MILHHLNTQTLLGKIIFTEEKQDLLKLLTEKMESFLRQGSLPTYLFWFLTPESNQRKKLIKKDKNLQTEDGSFKIELTPEALGGAILDGKLMPNLLLVYLTLHLYYRLSCFGGFNQIHYLEGMRTIYKDHDPGTEKFLSDVYSFGFNLIDSDNKEPSGLDIYLYPELMSNFESNFKNKKLSNLFEENSEIIYNILNEI